MPEASIRHQLPTLGDIVKPPAIDTIPGLEGSLVLRGHCPHGVTLITLEPCKDERIDLSAPTVRNTYDGRIRKDHSVKFGCDHLKGVVVT